MATIETRPLVIGVAVCVGVFVGVAVGVGVTVSVGVTVGVDVVVGVFVGVGALMIEGKKNRIDVGVGVDGAAPNFWSGMVFSVRYIDIAATVHVP